MKPKIYYQDPTTGNSWDISNICTSPQWKTVRKGTPASFTFNAARTRVKFKPGGIVRFMDGNKGIFYGYVFRVKENGGKDEFSVTAYTQKRYLKNKNTYVFKDKRADEIVRMIAADFQLKTGKLVNTGYVIPSLVEDDKTLFDMILEALDETLRSTGKMYCLWDDYGKLCLSSIEDSKLNLLVGDGSLATSYTLETDIDSDTFNKIKLVRDNKEKGWRDLYVFQDSRNIKRWGLLQYFEKVDENLPRSMIEERGDNLLLLKNRPKRTMQVEAIADLSVRAGKLLYVQFMDADVHQYMVVDEATHKMDKETMSLKVMVV